MTTDSIFESIFYSCHQFRLVIYTGATFWTGRVRWLYYKGISKLRSCVPSFLFAGKAKCPWNIEIMLFQECSKSILVLQNFNRLERTKRGKIHLVLYIGCRNDSRVTCKRHYAVNLKFTSSSKYCFFVDDAHIAILIAVFVGNVIRKIICCYHVITLLMSCFYHWQKVSKSAKEHKFFLCHNYFVIQLIIRSISSSLSVWCIGKHNTLSAILWALGRFSLVEDGRWW